MLLGGVLSLLIAQLFGKDVRTDAFFAAYGVYAVGLTFSQTFRLTAVSRLVRAEGSEMVTVLLGSVAVMTIAVGIPMVILADPLGALLVASDPSGVAATSLRILWIALAGQLTAAMLATVLVVRGAFGVIGVATLMAGFISVGTFLVLEGPLGIQAAAIGLAASGLWLTAAFGWRLTRTGWRPTSLGRRAIKKTSSEALRLSFASSTFIGPNLAFVICMALAARQGEGDATLFSYGYVLAVMLVGVTVNVSAMVRSPAVVASRERASEAASVGLLSFRFTVVLCGPVLAMAVLVGKPVLNVALGSQFGGGDINEILLTLVCLVGWILGSAAGIFAVVELLARDETRRLAILALVQVVAVLALGLAGAATAGIAGLAVTLSVTSLSVSLVQLRWAFGEAWRSVARQMLRASGRQLVVLTVAFAPSILVLTIPPQSTLIEVGAAMLAAALVGIASHIAWPRETRALAMLLRRATPQGKDDDRPTSGSSGSLSAGTARAP